MVPELDAPELRERLGSKRRFVWLKREITPPQRISIHRLGLPGIGFLSENKRVYPSGAEVSHVIGHVNIDNQGIAGHREVAGQDAASPICISPGSPPTACRSRWSSPSTCACSMRCATN